MPTNLTRRLALASALTFALGTGGTALAGAGQTVEVETTLVMKETFPAFHGKVKADNENCVEQRTVKVFKKKNNGKKLLGKTKTSNKGKWKVVIDPLKSGAYFSVVKRVEQGTAGTIYDCLRDRSQIAVVD